MINNFIAYLGVAYIRGLTVNCFVSKLFYQPILSDMTVMNASDIDMVFCDENMYQTS